MIPVRAVIADDELDCLQALQEILSRYCPQVEVIAQCAGVVELTRAVTELRPELLFLDIEMPGGNILDWLRQMHLPGIEIIFVTAHEKYAIQAIRFSALDYLLKPIEREELMQAVSNAQERIWKKEQDRRLQLLFYNLQAQHKDKKIALPSSRGMEFVRLSEILYCKADNNYTIFYLADKTKIMVSRTIGEYEDLLKDYNFLRIHQSHIINLHFMKSYSKGEGGTVLMTDNTELEVSRRKKEVFLRRIQEL